MTTRNRALILLVVQAALVCSIAGKFLYERATRPRIWVKVEQYDPSRMIRGRYLSLTAIVNACGLPSDAGSEQKEFDPRSKGMVLSSRNWRVRLKVKDGNLAVENAAGVLPHSETGNVYLPIKADCRAARFIPAMDLYISDLSRINLPGPKAGDLWLEVTVPKKGPPRAIQLATSINGVWKKVPLR